MSQAPFGAVKQLYRFHPITDGMKPVGQKGSLFDLCATRRPASLLLRVLMTYPANSKGNRRIRREEYTAESTIPPSLHHWGRGTASAVEGVRLIHPVDCRSNRRIWCGEHRRGLLRKESNIRAPQAPSGRELPTKSGEGARATQEIHLADRKGSLRIICEENRPDKRRMAP